MRAFLALAARWERVERWNILGGVLGRLFWFGEIGRFVVLWEIERFGLLTGGGLEQDLFNELLIPISTQRAFLYIYIRYTSKRKVSSHCCLTYLYPPPPTKNKNQHRRKES